MAQANFWNPGSHIVYREIWRNQIWSARPMIVVQDTPELIVLFLPAGTRWKRPSASRAGLMDALRQGKWQLTDVIWQPGSVLYLIQPGCGYAVWVMRDQNEQFTGWYVNLQEPVRRTRIGFDSMDQELDIMVAPDRSEWHWKDEEELLEAERLGLYSSDELAKIRAAGASALATLTVKDSIFSDRWIEWTPPIAWPIPELPPAWSSV